MNRVRMMMFAGVLGAFGFGTASAQAPSMTSAPAPTYPYAASGGYFYGGFYYAAPRPAPRHA